MTFTAESEIVEYRLFPSPCDLIAETPLRPEATATVVRARSETRSILNGTDDRLLVITGPCSVHDPQAALDYAARLAQANASLADELLIIMRAYVEKPRTVTGWAGLVSDPGMDGSNDMHRGLLEARRLLAGIAALGVPAACEWVNPAIAPYFADAVTWSAIGARTTESPPHRHLASALPTPVGFKNATDGHIHPAINACLAAASPQTFLGITPAATLALVTSPGNPHCHVVLRGGRSGPNFDPPSVATALNAIEEAGLPRRVVIDASHGNSRKDHRRQPAVALTVADQIAAGEHGIAGVMLESFLIAGRQEPGDPAILAYGQSVTDACMDIATTEQVLQALAAAVRRRRGASK